MNEVFRLKAGGPHSGQPVFALGEPLGTARAAVIMAHGRGAGANDMLSLAEKLPQEGFIFLAPQAAERRWYPNRFSAPIPSNQPWLDSALAGLEEISQAAVTAGIPVERQLLMGFSQGACLALEFAARSGRPYGGVAGLAGSLIGPLDTPQKYPAGIAGAPVFLGCSDVDPFIPKEFVQHSASVLENLGASVTTRFYPGLDHRINLDELHALASMMEKLV